MALSFLFPKRNQSDPTSSSSTPSPSSFTSSQPLPIDHTLPPKDLWAEEERLPGRDEHGNIKLPPVALYVSGAALALTITLTALIVPYARQVVQAGKASATEAAAQASAKASASSSATKVVKPPLAATTTPSGATSAAIPKYAVRPGILMKGLKDPHAFTPPPVNPALQPTLLSESSAGHSTTTPPGTIPATTATSTTSPEQSEMPQSDPAAPADPADEDARHTGALLGVYALGIATGVVGLSAGLGVWITAKIMGVDSMEEFAARARSNLTTSLPALSQAIDNAKVAEEREMVEDGGKSIWMQLGEMMLGGDGGEGKRGEGTKAEGGGDGVGRHI